MIRSAHQTGEKWPRRTLRAASHYFEVSRHRSREAILGSRPEALKHLHRIDQKVWKQYQTHLGRISPLERAEFYGRHMRERGLRSASAVARAIGEADHVVRRYLRLLDLPDPIREYLRVHKTPEIVRYFTERRLRELVRIKYARAACRQFQSMVAKAKREARVWKRLDPE